MKAAASGHERIVDLLLEAGANPNCATGGGRTAAIIAAIQGYETIAKELREAQRNR